jgi:hypothetical protein
MEAPNRSFESDALKLEHSQTRAVTSTPIYCLFGETKIIEGKPYPMMAVDPSPKRKSLALDQISVQAKKKIDQSQGFQKQLQRTL